MGLHRFALIVSGPDHEADDFEDRFLRAGCDDATISVEKGAIVLAFSREGRSLTRAIFSAVNDVQAAGAKALRVEPDPFVSLSEIAGRAHLSRAVVMLFARGERGRDFPPPVARVTSNNPLWDWVAVARWMYRRHDLALKDVVAARVMRQANRALAMPDVAARILARRFSRSRRIDRRV